LKLAKKAILTKGELEMHYLSNKEIQEKLSLIKTNLNLRFTYPVYINKAISIKDSEPEQLGDIYHLNWFLLNTESGQVEFVFVPKDKFKIAKTILQTAGRRLHQKHRDLLISTKNPIFMIFEDHVDDLDLAQMIWYPNENISFWFVRISLSLIPD
jgi:hypothetical protein